MLGLILGFAVTVLGLRRLFRKRLEIHVGVGQLKSQAVLQESASHDLQKRTGKTIRAAGDRTR